MQKTPDDPLAFIRRCVRDRKIYWMYHVNMRLARRYTRREDILAAGKFHIQFATDVEGGNVRIVTTYLLDPDEWEPDLKTRRSRK
jgi:hypothetical protein